MTLLSYSSVKANLIEFPGTHRCKCGTADIRGKGDGSGSENKRHGDGRYLQLMLCDAASAALVSSRPAGIWSMSAEYGWVSERCSQEVVVFLAVWYVPLWEPLERTEVAIFATATSEVLPDYWVGFGGSFARHLRTTVHKLWSFCCA